MTVTADAVRVDSPGALCAVLPHLVGFTPSDSLCLVWLHASRVVLTMRVDVEALDLDPATLAAMIPPAVVVESDAVAAVIWSDDRTPSPDDVDRLAAVLDQAAPGVDVRDVLAVHRGRWLSLLCEDPDCCPPDGKPLDVAAPDAVELIGRGSAPLGSRDELAAECVPAGAVRCAANPDGLPLEEWRGERVDSWAEILDPSTGGYSPDGAWRAACSLHDIRVRDVLLWHASRLDLDALAWLDRVALDVVRASHPLDAAPALTVAAMVAYLRGDGARALVRLDASDVADPDYSLAGMLRAAVTGGLPPQAWRDAMSGLTLAECRHGSGATADA